MNKVEIAQLIGERLEHSFEMETEHSQYELTRLGYLAEHIFNFITYCDDMSELFAGKAIEVCEAITNRSTFEYIKDDENHKWFLIMCNMPFFREKLEWGSSIRGAWWDEHPREKYNLVTCGLWVDRKQVLDPDFTGEEWVAFIVAVVAFSKVEVPA